MDFNLVQTETIIKDDTVYLLDKAIWDRYDMVQTRINVINFLREYKEARAMNIEAIMFNDRGLTSHIDPNRTSFSFRKNGGFAINSDKKIDSQMLLDAMVPLIVKVKESFTKDEKEYYEYCLASNNSEQNFCNIMNITKPGLLPIKNSCLLKIAFATNNAVYKKDKI